MADTITKENDKLIVESSETKISTVTFTKGDLELKIALCDQSILQAEQQIESATAEKDYFNSLLKQF